MNCMTSYPIAHNFPSSPAYGNRVLIASPSTVVRQRVLESLRSPVRRFEQATGGAEALVHLESGSWQVLFLDRKLPDLDAEELSLTVRQRYPGIQVVMLDSEQTAEQPAEENAGVVGPLAENSLLTPAWRAWPEEAWRKVISQNARMPGMSLPDSAPDSLRDSVPPNAILLDEAERGENPECEGDEEALGHSPRVGDSHCNGAAPLPGMIGNSAIMQPVYRLARLLAPRNTTVLITGPTGSGKEVVAHAIHYLSPRAAKAFTVVNCAAIPETMLEAELFGYARGAFTGAMQAYGGRIQAAQGGTLFLDEIGEMPLSLQPKLLRFLEQKELQRLGSAEIVRVDARIISATNAHLLSLVREGKFREDLYYRLCGFPIEIPSLRDRCEDIVQLAAHFIGKYSERRPAPQLTVGALQVLRVQPWAGNIRELQNVIERALILTDGQALIRPEHLMLTEASLAAAGCR
jgi:DNA-binding NtrC family response regulator